MDTQLKRAIICSNCGSRHIERGDYDKGIRSLTSAFSNFKRCYQRLKRITPETLRKQTTSTFNIDQWMRRMRNADNDDFVIYQRPIVIPDFMDVTLEACALVSTAITFNLALANHLSAIETNNRKDFETAAKLYEYGFNLERIRGKFFVSPFFLITVLNNLGHIHRSIEDFQRSHKCLGQLLSTLLYLTQTKGANPKDLEVFFGNTSTVLSRTVTRCAGAA